METSSVMHQLLSRCCLHNGLMPSFLFGLPSSLSITSVASGGEDGTVISEIFSILSYATSSIKNQQTGETNNFKGRLNNLVVPFMPSIGNSCPMFEAKWERFSSVDDDNFSKEASTSPFCHSQSYCLRG